MNKCLLHLTLTALAVFTVPAAASAGYVDTLTALDGLVSYWDLNESSGTTTAADSVINDAIDGNNPGLYIGTGITVGDAGPRPADGWTGFATDNRAPTFIKMPDAKLEMGILSGNISAYGGRTDLSMVGWLRVTDPDAGSLSNMFGGLQQMDFPRYSFGINRYPTTLNGFITQQVPVTPENENGINQLSLAQGNLVDPAQWHFLAMTYGSGTTGKLYIDGVEVSSDTSDTPNPLVPTVAMVFGNDIGANQRALHGQLDELAMFDRALTTTEVENLFIAAGGSLPDPPAVPGQTATAPFVQTANALGGLRNHWGFSESSGTTAADITSANTGTFVNTSGDPIVLDQPGPTPTDTHNGYELQGFAADNSSAQFIWNTGANHMESENGQVLGDPITGDSFADGVSELSMSFWFKNNYSGEGYVAGFAKASSTGRYVFTAFSPNATSMVFYTKADNDAQMVVSGVPIDETAGEWGWHHIVQTWDGTEKRMRVFVDGEMQYNSTNPAMSENLSVPDGFYLGRDAPGNTRNLGGFVDEVMLFDRALSEEEIFELYDSAFFAGAGDSILGDANRDGVVDGDDAAALASNWQTTDGSATWSQGDFNNDGNVDDIDATILAANWQSGTSASVPEPCSMALLAGMFAAMLMVRRKR